jgi:hypothetical protein
MRRHEEDNAREVAIMSKSRKKAPEGLVTPEHRYKLNAQTRAAIALAAKIPLVAEPKESAKKPRRSKAKKRPGRARR